MTGKKTRTRPSPQRRSAARLAAVQALYDADLTGAPVNVVLDDFIQHGIGAHALVGAPDDEDAEIEAPLAEPDARMFAGLVRGALAERQDLDAMVGGALTGEWTVERLEAVLRAILRAGAFELARCPEVPTKVVISEYVDVAHAFYAGPEPGLVNAVLDRIARVVRSEELGENGRDR